MSLLHSVKDLPAVALARELFRRWWGLELAFADSKGYVLDHAEGKVVPSENELCRAALFSKEGFRRCNESVKAVADHLRAGAGAGRGARALAVASASASAERTYLHTCHLGLDVLAAPLRVGGELVGLLFVGGALGTEPSSSARTELAATMRELAELDADSVTSALASAPRMTEADRERARDLLAMAADEVEAHWRIRGLGDKASAEAKPHPFTEIVGDAPAIRELLRRLGKVVASDSTVLIHGESGTGKELIARAIHYHGSRAKKNFVVQNCSAFNDNLLESALFGHVRGAFTGAVRDQKGLFEVADGGTFFLDEIGDMSAALQVKLLRVLQEGTLTPVGGTKPIKVDVRIVAASHKDLYAMVQRREFREDLYYRVNVVKLTVPPLRERVADIPRLVDHFMAKHSRGLAIAPRITDGALDALVRYPWPGNIRELENELERAIVLGGDTGVIDTDVLSTRVMASAGAASHPTAGAGATIAALEGRGGTLRQVMESVEQEVILAGLVRTHWNKSQLAKELGVSRSYLIQKCTYYGLERKEPGA